MEYKYYNGNIPVRRKSLIEIRKHFIQHHTRTEAVNIFRLTKNYAMIVGRIYWAGGTWNYKEYDGGYIYELDDNGKVIRNTRSRF